MKARFDDRLCLFDGETRAFTPVVVVVVAAVGRVPVWSRLLEIGRVDCLCRCLQVCLEPGLESQGNPVAAKNVD